MIERIKNKQKQLLNRIKSIGKPKIFCIGLNKTGTTSVRKAWEDLGIAVGNEGTAKRLFEFWALRDFDPIIKYCNSAQAFQDSPFSFPYTYIVLDQAFPGSKFILTVRNDAEEWYSSISRFHAKLWGGGKTPTKDDLMNAVNFYKGRPWQVNRVLFDTPENEPYRKENLLDFYNRHNKEVVEYFKLRQNDLLVLNLKEKGAYLKFCRFIEREPNGTEFPWENRT
jgi:hypothetical protein